MHIPEANHPVWPFLRTGLLVVTLLIVLTFNYSSGFDPVKDPRAVIIVAIIAGGFDFVKRSLTLESK
jgi:hypothetical protein